ncbi:enolase C-terminal domain-like protein [Reinekea marinisedimentorum]|uniref:O-succinylbenzoate synthase n=1 Tax=Reinekea marinisedimentorum TaxID=230495 RepID=A0A4R3I281_9GAMM|nr:enolase C-terminal domain-like protein [Reinekea marinisedimentorum]TCS39728.1 O-succinylbenzoate synthase [Reinekea marinisedimentorum]
MIIWTAWRGDIAFKKPLQLKRGSVAVRSLLFIRSEQQGSICWHEVAPLPGWSQETLMQAEAFLLANQQRCLTELAALPGIPASVSSALWLAQLPEGIGPVRSNQLLLSGESIAGEPSDVVKVKVGVQPLLQEIERLKTLLVTLRPGQRIRLDANQSWSYTDLAQLTQALGDSAAIDYIEEPLLPGLGYSDWQRICPYGYALDESLHSGLPQYHPGLKALVIKPTLLGKAKTLSCLSFTAQHQTGLTVSSSFESPLGLSHLKRLARQWAPNGYHGLNTEAYLQTQLQTGPEQALRPVTQLLHWQPLW